MSGTARTYKTVLSHTSNLCFFWGGGFTSRPEFFRTLSVTRADKGNVNLMLISGGCSVATAFSAKQNWTLLQTLRHRGEGGWRSPNLLNSELLSAVTNQFKQNIQIKKINRSAVSSKFSLCVSQKWIGEKNFSHYEVPLYPSLLPVIFRSRSRF